MLKKTLRRALTAAWRSLSVWLPVAVAGGLPAVAGARCALPDDTLAEAAVMAPRLSSRLAAPVAALRLDSAALALRGAASVADALRWMPGALVRDYGGAGGLKTVSVRSLGAAHTAVSYDGLPLAPGHGGQVDLGRLPSTSSLAAVSLSAGGEARLLVPPRLLAAAHVALASRLPRPGVRRLEAGLEQGSFGMVSPSFGAMLPLGGRGAMGLNGRFLYGTNDYPYTLRNVSLVTRERRRGSRMQAGRAEADHLMELPGGQWHSKLVYDESHRRLPGQVTLYTARATERLTERQAAAQTMWRQAARGVALMAGARYAWQESRYADLRAEYPGGALRENYRQRQAYATAGAALTRGRVEGALAVDYGHDVLASNLADAGRVRRDALLQSLSLRGRFFGRRPLTLTLRGLAYLCVEQPPAGQRRLYRRLTPALTAVWMAVERPRVALALRASAQELFRLPSFTEAYYRHLGDTGLRPELTRQAAAGLTLQLGRRAGGAAGLWELSADAYAARVDDKIVSVPYNLFVWRTVNLGRVSATGLDASLEGRQPLGRHLVLRLAASYALRHAADRTAPGTPGYGRALPYAPRHTGNVAVACEHPWLSVSAGVACSGGRWASVEHLPSTRLPAYAEANFALWRSFTMGHVRLDVRADLLNAFDEQYEVVRRYPMPGRSYRLGVKAVW